MRSEGICLGGMQWSYPGSRHGHRGALWGQKLQDRGCTVGHPRAESAESPLWQTLGSAKHDAYAGTFQSKVEMVTTDP